MLRRPFLALSSRAALYSATTLRAVPVRQAPAALALQALRSIHSSTQLSLGAPATHAQEQRSHGQSSALPSIHIRSDSNSVVITPPKDSKYYRSHQPTTTLSPLWLRDNCPCPKCIHPSTRQKLHASSQIPLDISVSSVQICEEGLALSWSKGLLDVGDWEEPAKAKSGHQSLYPWEMLLGSYGGSASEHRQTTRMNHQPILWDGQLMNDKVLWLDYKDYIHSPEALRQGLQQLQDYGLFFVKNVPREDQQVATVAERIGHLRHTFYGKTWDVRSEPDAKNIAYTNLNLGLHMDLLYMEAPPGVQLLHSLENSVPGGTSIYMDSFKAAELLKKEHPQDYEILCKTPTTFHYRNANHHLHFNRPTIALDEHNDTLTVNYAPPFQGPLELPQNEVKAFYGALKKFARYIEQPDLQYRYTMQPGDCMVFANRRVLHARTAFDPTKGRRHLKGCYVDLDMFKDRIMNRDHIQWVEKDGDPEHVSISSFATKFRYVDRHSAEVDFLALVHNPRISAARRERLLRNFGTFNINWAEGFWAKRASISKADVIAMKAADDSMEVGYRQAKIINRQRFEEEEREDESDLLPRSTGDKSQAERTQALSSSKADAESRTSTAELSTPRSPPEMERDDDDETAIHDLKVLGGQEVFDNEDGDMDNNGEAVDDDDVESIEDLANEVVELIEKSEPGFHPLIRALYHAVRGTPFEKPMVKPELSAEQSFLYDFVWNSVDMFQELPMIKQKDLFVALSGIVDLDVHSNFPEHTNRLLDCKAVDLEYPRIHQHLEARLNPLKKRLEKDLSLFDDGSDEKIVVEILLILVKLSMPDQYRRPKLTETSTMVVWSNIWTVLFESTPVSVQLGETILREAQKDQLTVRKIVGAGAAKGAKGASGRRLDFRLVASVKATQSSSEFVSLTLCNNEHKAPDVGAQTFNILHRKNNRLNKSVVANGLVTRTGPTVFLDVQGFEGWWYTLLPFKDVFLCCQLRPKPLALPTDEIGLASFLCSDSLEILLGYR
ncbi:hypothetical protein BGW38_002189, partial [Lunasporangiospora selenospora]